MKSSTVPDQFPVVKSFYEYTRYGHFRLLEQSPWQKSADRFSISLYAVLDGVPALPKCYCHQVGLRHVNVPSALHVVVLVGSVATSSWPVLRGPDVLPDKSFCGYSSLPLLSSKSSLFAAWHSARDKSADEWHSRRSPWNGQSGGPVRFRYWVFQSGWSIKHALKT